VVSTTLVVERKAEGHIQDI
jgi:hypothetical protein